jgi:Spy/CpxP family protein refolding chaperone
LRQELDLTPEQMLRLRTLFRDRLRQGGEPAGLDPEGPGGRSAWPELETDLRRILTPEQMAAYQRLKAEGRRRVGEKADLPDRSSPGPPMATDQQ